MQMTEGKTSVGTPSFIAPEISVGKGFYDADKADVYALGISLLTLLTGSPLPIGQSGQVLSSLDEAPLVGSLEAIEAKLPFLSPECKHFIHKSVRYYAQDRLSMRELLLHPWLTGQKLEG